ncbi:MAG: glycine--tRNA ligase subunit beta [Bacillota bacterium]|jgi:glycyl-tRNA synthetase beta chain
MLQKDLLFELGVEEIPARFLPPAIKQMQSLAEITLKENLLTYDEIKIWATPRRLVLFVAGLADRQPDTNLEVKGPSLAIAYDNEGDPTKALLGFCKGQGVNEDDLIKKEIAGNTYVFANKQKKGLPAMEVLPQLLGDLVHNIYFPKPMRWGYEEMRFARPIRWIVALLGQEIIPLNICGQTSSNISSGHRVFGSDHIVLNNPGEYLQKLADNYVIVDQDKRRKMVWEQVQKVAIAQGGQVKPDPELLEEIVFLLEYPTALMGRFEEKYLHIPEELIITPMREHQRYFPVYDGNGSLMARFITVRNGDDNYLEVVAAGNEKVLKARLADAEFFWLEDIKKPLDNNIDKLSTIVFHEKLGTLLQKVQRVSKLAAYLAEKIALQDQQISKIERTIYLMKGDLLSNVVYEFPELQGIMGEYYANYAGEDAEVAQAIKEHYLPRFAGDDLPQTITGKVCAICDKLDSLVGFFAVDLQPTGSQDPYALRRAANGIVQIIIEQKSPLTISLADLIGKSYDLLATELQLIIDKDSVIAAVRSFLGGRLENILTEQGVRYDVNNAIAAVGYDDLSDAYIRAITLQQYRHKPAFTELLVGFTRADNLLKNAAAKDALPLDLSVREKLLVEKTEIQLYNKLQEVAKKLHTIMLNKDYTAALAAIATLHEDIACFFNDVMVMVPEIELRNNRLALLNEIVTLSKDIGDLAQIVN